MKEKVYLKELLINKKKVERIAADIARVWSDFDQKNFVKEVVGKFPPLELKARIDWISQNLRKHLPQDFKEATNILLKAMPKENDPTLTDNDFGDFIHAPFTHFVALYGREKKLVKFALSSLKEMTKRFSAEDSIRYFLNAFPQETLAEIEKWAKDKNYHVRRLASEGTRPKLPWSQKISIHHGKPLSILNNLFFDKTRYVVRSVANHVNDISKIDSKLAIETLSTWKKQAQQNEAEMEYIIKHALRTLIKNGDKKALALLGVGHAKNVSIKNLMLSSTVKMNSPLTFSFALQSLADEKLIIDYVIYFVNKSGKATSKKVFKLKTLNMKKGQTVRFQKSHMMRQFMTTRTLNTGKHKFALQINGETMFEKPFTLVD
jgi:3-methyladenine DNA glycosylase AlkC